MGICSSRIAPTPANDGTVTSTDNDQNVTTGNIIRRLAINQSAVIGSLYDATEDRLLKVPILDIPSMSVISIATTDNPAMETGILHRKSLSDIIRIDKQLCLSIYLNIATSQGISLLIKCPYVINKHTRYLSYYYSTKQTYFTDEENVVNTTVIPSSIYTTTATHIVTSIQSGIHVVVILQLLPKYESDLDRLLEKIEQQLITKTFRIEPGDEDLFNQLIDINVFSNIPDIAQLTKLTDICQKLSEIIPDVTQHRALEYTLWPIRWFFPSYPADRGIYYSLEQKDMHQMELYFYQLLLVRKSLKIPFQPERKRLVEKHLKPQFDEVQQQMLKVEELYQEKIKRSASLIRKIRHGDVEQDAYNESLIDDQSRVLLEKAHDVSGRLNALKGKAHIIDDLKKNRIDYWNVKELVKDGDHNLESIIEQLQKINNGMRIYCFDDKLEIPNSFRWYEYFTKLMDEHRNNPQLECVYADFSYCSCQLMTMNILLSIETSRKRRVTWQKQSSITTQPSSEVPPSSTSKPTQRTSKPALATSKSIPLTSQSILPPSKQTRTTLKPALATSESIPLTSQSILPPSKQTRATSKPVLATSKSIPLTSQSILPPSKQTRAISKPAPVASNTIPSTSKAAHSAPKPTSSTSKSKPSASKLTSAGSKPKPSTLINNSIGPRNPLPIKFINVLLVGESGVGKSTFINAFANYLRFDTLQQARSGDPIVLMPVSFLMTVGHDFEERIVRFGRQDPNEDHNQSGQSVTQHCRAYVFTISYDTKIRMIDTPGMGDTRGLDQDDRNMQHILLYINNLSHLDAICILLKPNEARLNVVLRSYFTRLLGFLGEDVRNNIIFCFTNTRATFFAPGNTGPLLRKMLESHSIKNIPFKKANTFCFDNESFRYLVALLNGIAFDNYQKEEYKQSWMTSVSESKRLLQYIRHEFHPFPQRNWQSIEHAQFQLTQMIRPMLETLRNLFRNSILQKEKSSKLPIQLLPKALSWPSTICIICERIPGCFSDFWILPDDLHTFSDKCNNCQHNVREHLNVEYKLEYGNSSKTNRGRSNTRESNVDQLKGMILELAYFFAYIVPHSERDDPIMTTLTRMIAEEDQIDSLKDSKCLNSTLYRELNQFNEIYKQKRNNPMPNTNSLNIPKIYKLIFDISGIDSINKQINAIKQFRQEYMKTQEKYIS